MLLAPIMLLCMETADGTVPYCTTVASPHIVDSPEACLSSLEAGILEAEGLGWTVMGYDCFDWARGKDLNDLLQQDL